MRGNFKVRCIESASSFTIGRIYNVINGTIRDNNDFIFDRGYEDLEELNSWLYSQFELVKEDKTNYYYSVKFNVGKYGRSCKVYDFKSKLELKKGDIVIVETCFGLGLATVIQQKSYSEIATKNIIQKVKNENSIEMVKVEMGVNKEYTNEEYRLEWKYGNDYLENSNNIIVIERLENDDLNFRINVGKGYLSIEQTKKEVRKFGFELVEKEVIKTRLTLEDIAKLANCDVKDLEVIK